MVMIAEYDEAYGWAEKSNGSPDTAGSSQVVGVMYFSRPNGANKYDEKHTASLHRSIVYKRKLIMFRTGKMNGSANFRIIRGIGHCGEM